MIFESGLMYDSNAEEDHLPSILMAAVVAASILKECPVHRERNRLQIMRTETRLDLNQALERGAALGRINRGECSEDREWILRNLSIDEKRQNLL